MEDEKSIQLFDHQQKIDDLEAENKRIQNDFNIQRAKMKDLFLQKEEELIRKNNENLTLKEEIIKLKEELDDVKSQLVVADITLQDDREIEKRKATEEVASLQRLVHESVEQANAASNLYKLQMESLQNYIKELQNEISILKNVKLTSSPQHNTTATSQESSSLAPSVVLNALKQGIVKKFGADTSQENNNNEGDIDNKKFEYDHIQEDAEVLRSLIIPLEDQIKALKEKLRTTDDLLQKCQECGHGGGVVGVGNNNKFDVLSTESSPKHQQHQQQQQQQQQQQNLINFSDDNKGCDMCCNYEAQLVKEQQLTKDLEKKLKIAEKTVERHKEDLLKEIGFRKEMEEKWNEKKEEHKVQVAKLTTNTIEVEKDLADLQQLFQSTTKEINEILGNLREGREKLQKDIDQLQNENDILVGKYTKHSQELESEEINLPNDVVELHELILRFRQELIIEKVAKETANGKINDLQFHIEILQDRNMKDQQDMKDIQDSLNNEIAYLKKQIRTLEIEKSSYSTNREKLENSEKLNAIRITDLQSELHNLNKNKQQLENQIAEFKNRIVSLQYDLEANESVQKDFVCLSQNLQIELEKIRESDKQVRWQHDEDVQNCSTCNINFNINKKDKHHCRHCGQIFCKNCLSHTVKSGPNGLPSMVCDVCHTLLVKSSAPYFSEAPPMT